MKDRIRSPIIVTVGHVDHGKTTLLDRIRGTAITKLEPGMLSQHIGASYIPIETVKKISGELLEKMKIGITIPGLLLLDTPGHAAFITLRKRGGAVSDLAILVVDLTEGFQEQTDESLAVLKEYKTPFIVAATKVDRIQGWFPEAGHTFLESFEKQREPVKEEVEKRVYNLVQQLAERGFNSERFDRVEDFTKNIAIVPCSGITGEGIPELLMVLAGLAQTFLKDRLQLSNIGKGTVLEVKDVKGFGTTLDVILFDGIIRKGDWIVIGGKQPLVTRVKALLEPRPLGELRVEKQFTAVDSAEAAAGIKIVASEIEKVIAGSPIVAVLDEKEIDSAKAEVQSEIEEVEFTSDREGVVLKADTIGSLEAMIKLIGEANIPVRKAEVGSVTKQDIVEVQNLQDKTRKVVLAFNVKTLDDAETNAKDLGVTIFTNNIIYRLIDEYKEWSSKAKEREIQEKLASVNRPCIVKILKGFVFRTNNPAIFGVEVQKGVMKAGVRMKREDGKTIGVVKVIEKEGHQIGEAKSGDKVAISMDEPTIGRQIEEGNVLSAVLTETDLKTLREVFEHLSGDERELLKVHG